MKIATGNSFGKTLTIHQQGGLMHKPSELSTISNAARNLDCSPDFLYRQVKSGSLPHYRVGSDYRVDLNEVRQCLRVEKRQGTK